MSEENFDNQLICGYSSVCHTCGAYEKTLKRCTGCNLVAYCSIAHQQINWTKHKPFCNVVKNLLATSKKSHIFENGGDLNQSEWNGFREFLKGKLEDGLKRRLTVAENLLWMFPRVCAVCRNTNQRKLFECVECISVSYCSEKHYLENQSEHKQLCSLLKLHFELANAKNLNDLDTGNFDLTVSNNECITHLPDDISKFIVLYTNFNSEDKIVQIKLSEDISFVLTLIYVMQQVGIVKDRVYMSEEPLCVHLIGAGQIENNLKWALGLKILFKWIKNITRVKIIFVGPECYNRPALRFDFDKTRFMIIKYYPLMYHDYLKNREYEKSSFNMAFNCGFHEFQRKEALDNWKATLPLIATVPLGFTSYTEEEAKLDLEILLKYNKEPPLDIIIERIKNPYSSLKPYRDWEQVQSIFYNNNYISIVKPTKKCHAGQTTETKDKI